MLDEMFNRKAKGECPFCGKDMTNPVFRDELSKKEFSISGICQECQDNYFKDGGIRQWEYLTLTNHNQVKKPKKLQNLITITKT